MTLLELETLRMDSITGYRLYLTTRREGTNSRITVSRKLSSLRSLFHYLSQIAEDEDFYPLLKRNIMAKVEIKRIHKPKDTAAKLKGKILEEEELQDFITYIHEGYGHDVEKNKQALYAHEQNKVRDACIASLILNSGLRVSEVVNLNLADIDLNNKMLHVYRKGNNDEPLKPRSTSGRRPKTISSIICSCGRPATRCRKKKKLSSSRCATARMKDSA